MNGFANALIGAAAADVAAHEIVNISIRGIGFFREQRRRGHDLPALTIAALRNVNFDPSLLYRVVSVGRKSLDGGDFLAGDGGNRGDAGARGFTVNVNG